MDTGFRPHAARLRAAGAGRMAAAVAALVLGLGDCAYFNTFYNAKQLYKDAESTREKGSAEQAAGKYDAAIKKCLDLIRYHPNSGYVDDALFMIGMAHFHRSEYVQAQASFQDLLDRFPSTEFAERAWFQLGLAALRVGDVGGAASAFESLSQAFPKSGYVVEAAYRTAEARLATGDDEEAREALQGFVAQYPDSRFVTDARVQIARTYYDEARFEAARREYEQVLKRGLPDDLRYEAELHMALTKREQAASILADPALYTSADLPEGLRLEFETTGADTGAALGAAAPAPAATVEALPESLRTQRRQAEALLKEAADDLQRLRKRAAKLGQELQHRIEIAVTLGLMGQPDAAIAELDQIARTKPHDDVGAQAYFEIAEIQRRLGRLNKAQEAYQSAERAKAGTPLAQEAQKKSAAIQARSQALQKLHDAPQVLHRYRVARGLEPPDRGDAAGTHAGSDSLTAAIDVETRFEDLAATMLRVAEIDLFELDQPRLALREFQRVLTEFAGSSQCPRAAFAVGWIYENSLRDRALALAAYEGVMRDYPQAPQAREARERYEALRAAPAAEEVTGSSSRP